MNQAYKYICIFKFQKGLNSHSQTIHTQVSDCTTGDFQLQAMLFHYKIRLKMKMQNRQEN